MQRTRFCGFWQGRRYKLWWSGNSDGTVGVGVLLKEELCVKVVNVQRRSDRVMVLEEGVLRIVCMIHRVAEWLQRKSIFMMI